MIKGMWIQYQSGLYLVLTIAIVACEDGRHQCNVPLGMGNNQIPDSAVTASIGSNPHRARLNGNGAWCFKGSEVEIGQDVALTVDLGSEKFVTAVQTQGPPLNLKNRKYNYHIGFNIESSVSTADPKEWNTCCGGDRVHFYSEDTVKDNEIVNLHSFGMLVLTRTLRLKFETTVKWAGDNEKCFRIEILGCSLDVMPKTNLTLRSLPSGWLEVNWDRPMVYIPTASISTAYYFPVKIYLVDLKWSEMSDGKRIENSTLMSSETTRLLVPGPLWGANYTLNLICPHLDVNVSCGIESIVATVEGCDPSSAACIDKNEVIFRHPHKIKSWMIRPTELEDETSKVFVSWISEGPGWTTTTTQITVIGDNGEIIIEKIINEEGHHMTLTELNGSIFKLTFTPQAEALLYIPSFSYDLHIIAWSSLDEGSSKEGFGAFVTDVTLEANVHWEGNMVVTWSPALVREGDLLNVTDENNITTLGINVTSEFTGQADLYNVSLIEENDANSLEELSVSGIEVLKAEFSLLKLETKYRVTISCDYGGIVVQCGAETVYTALPIKLTELNSQYLVYVDRAGGRGWYSHEESCKKNGGNLVTFGTEEEEMMLRPALLKAAGSKFKHFWIGLNKCRDNKGTLWSDGSQWLYSLLPRVDVGLSAATCCVKSEFSEVRKNFTWLGEACDSLLPAICEFKPRGLVGNVKNFTRGEASLTAATYQWEYEEKFWTPSSFTSTICPTLDLTTFQPTSQSCSVTSIPTLKRTFQSTGLSIFTEYNVSVCASLPSLKFNGVNQTILIRTRPKDEVSLEIDGSGHLNLMWAQLVSEFKEDDEIEMSLFEGKSLNIVKKDRFPAKNVTFGDLQLGEFYRVDISELSSNGRKETRDFYAYPPCDCTGCQDKTRCLMPSDKQVTKSLAMQQCKDEDSALASSTTKSKLEILLYQADKIFDDLWVSSSSLKGNVFNLLNSTIMMRGQFNEDAESILIATNSTVVTTTESVNECLVVSRSQRAIIVASDCREKHYAACEQKAPLLAVFPSPTDIITKVDETSLSFDWDSRFSGWKANYTIYYQRASEKKYKRALKYQTFTQPPVVIHDLAKNTDYTIELVADLGIGFISASPEFKRITSVSNTRTTLSASTGIKQNRTAVWMSAGWSPSPEFFLSHLICGALIITASISTMLLFFATGMFYQDCIAQLGFLFCVLVAYLLLLVAHPHYVEELEAGCVILSACLHFLFTAAFLFLALEALTMTHLLAEKIKSPFQNSNWALVVFAILLPLTYVIISAAIIQIGYPNAERDNCWVNISGPVVIVQCVPNAILMVTTIVLILVTIKSNEDNQPLLKDNEIRGRQSDSYHLRWVVLALTIELGVVWSSGVAAYHFHTSDAHAVFNIFTLILAVTIIFARTWLDDTFRSKINRLCCGTELTYKRSAMRSISARTRVAPSGMKDQRASSGFSTTTVRASRQSTGVPMYNLPNSPPPGDQNNSTVLIKRTYQFDDEL